MARRRRINKRVAVLLLAMGGIVVALVLTIAIRGIGGSGGVFDRLFPKDPKILMEQAKAAHEDKKYRVADKKYQEAIRAAKSNDLADLDQYYYEYARLNLEWSKAGVGLTKTQQGERLYNAVRQVRNALARNDKYVEAQKFLCDIFWREAENTRGRIGPIWSDFLKEAERYIALAPDDAEAYYRRGRTKAVLSQRRDDRQADEAVADFQKAVELKSDETTYWRYLIAFTASLESRRDQVEGLFAKAIETIPDDATLLIDYASYLQLRERNEEARQRLQEAIEKDPIKGNLALAKHQLDLKELDEALATLQKIVEIDPTEPQAYLSQAKIHAHLRDYDQAVAVLKNGMAAVESVVATQPDDRERRLYAMSQFSLNDTLANVLLEMVERGDENADRLIADAKACLEKLTALQRDRATLAKITGRIALAEGNYEQAVTQLELAYKGFQARPPGFDAVTASLLINIYLKQNLPGKAGVILDALLNLPGRRDNVTALMAKAKLLMRYRDYEKVDQVVDRVLKLDPKNAEAMNTKMVILALKGETPTLPADLTAVSARTVRMLLNRASVLWLDGRTNEALAYVEQLHQRMPTEHTVIVTLFSMYRSLNKLEQAEQLLDRAMEHYPDDPALRARRRLVRENDPAKQKAILMEEADSYPPFKRALEKANIEVMFAGRDPAGAAQAETRRFQYLQEAARIDPNAQDVVDPLFLYALKKRDYDLAEDCIERAGKANLDGSDGMLYRAKLEMIRQEYDKAIAAARTVLKTQPNRKDVRVLLGQAYRSKKRLDEAYDEFKIVADNDPGYAPALIGLAVVTAAQGKSDEHETYVRAAYRLAPQDRYLREEIMRLDAENTRPEEQIKQRERVLKLKPNDMANILGLAILYERVGRFHEAEAMYVTFNQKAVNKLEGARVVCGFYVRAGRFDDVQRTIEPLLDTSEDKVGALVLYGQMLSVIDPERARLAFEKAVSTNPQDPRSHVALAQYWASFQKWPQAVESMADYVRRRPEDLGGAKTLIKYQLEAGLLDQASEGLDRILRADPTDAGAITLQGALAMKQRQWDKALELFTRAIQDNPTYGEPLIYRARFYLSRGDPDKAKSDFQTAKRLTRRLDVAMQLGGVYEILKDYDNAELVYKEIHSERRSYTPAVDRLLAIYLDRQKWTHMEDLLGRAHELFPKHAGYWMIEAQMWFARENEPKKIAAMAKATELAPTSFTILRAYLRGLQLANDHEKVLEVSRPYLAKPTFVQLVSAIRAGSLAKLERHEEAEALFITSLQTVDAGFVLVLANQLREAYGLEGSVEKFKKWMGERAENWRLSLVQGLMFHETDRLPEAITALIEARRLAKDNDLAKFLANKHLGASHYQLKNFPEAEKAYVAALAVRAQDIQTLNNLAYLYTNDLNQPREALPYAERAATGGPDNAKILDTYGWTLARIGRFADAEQTLIRAVQLESPLTASRYHLGWVYEQIGRFEEALKQYRQGFEMVRTQTDDPLHEPLKEAVERVELRLKQRLGSEK